MEKQISDCPKCKKKYGWYEKRIQWGEQYYEANGEPSHYCDTNGRGGLRKYCSECNTDITKCVSDTPNSRIS